MKIQTDPRVTLEFGSGRGGQSSVLAQVNKMICSLLVCAQLKLILSRESDEDRRRCLELRSHF